MQQGALKYYSLFVNTRSALAEHGERLVGQYLLLCLYCAEQVNGGVIKNCKSWTKTQWLFRVGLEDCLVETPGLFHWDGDDLIVEGYNVEAEEKALSKRRGGKKAAEARWGRRDEDNNAPSNADCNTTSNAKRITECNADSNADCNTSGNTKERKGEERKGKERRGEKRREKEASPDGSRSTTPPSRSSLPLPSSPDEVEAHLKNEVGRGCLLLPPREIPECAQQYWADRDGLGWVDRSGVPISNWKSNAWSYAQRWARNLETKGPPPGEERDPFDPRFRKNI